MTTAVEINCETGVVTERPLTAEEIATNEAAAAQAEADRIAEEEAAAAKQAEKEAIAAKLGLTSEELLKLFS